MRRLITWFRGLSILTALLCVAPAAEEPKRKYDLRAGDAAGVLREFAAASGREILFVAEVVRGVRTGAVQGEFTPLEALARMLAGTQLYALQDERTGALAIRRRPEPKPPERSSPPPPSEVKSSVDPPPKSMKSRTLVALLSAWLTTKPVESAEPAADEKPAATVVLSPFEVNSARDVGYEANETLAGSRMNTALKDIATQVNVMTPEFLQDLAITNLNDAMRYSLNSENDDEIIEVSAPGNAGISATSRPFTGGGRTRGLGASNRAHDFFDTFIAIDSYNTERFTFSSGPNSILFGNSSPAGTIDTTFKRARTQRRSYGVDYRIDDRGSHRLAIDLNQPIVRNRFAVRLNALQDREHDWKAPAFTNQDRVFGSLTFTPFRKLTVRAYHETASIFSNPARNTLVQDHVTPWVNAGRPAFNNGGTAAFPAVTAPFVRRNVNTPYFILDASGVIAPVDRGGNTVLTQGFDTTTPAPNNFERSVLDENLFPFDRTFSGNANQTKINGWIRGALAELNPIENLHLEAGFNQERFRHRSVDLFNNAAADLYVDANRFLNDRVTPNPHFGRYFFEDTVPISVKNYGYKEQARLSASYELNLEKRPGWQKWLGRHRAALLFDRLATQTIYERSDLRVSGDYSFTTAAANTRLINIRYYLDPKHQTAFLPFNPLADGLISVPGAVDANGKPVVLAAWDPSTPPNAPETARSIVNSQSLALQSFFLQNRLVLSYGQRSDKVDVQDAPTLAANWDFNALVASDVPWNTIRTQKPTTRLKSAVLHPLNWLSLSYAQSNSEQVAPIVRRNLDGSLATFGSGRGKEYGITLRWSNRLSFRFARYENTSIGNLSSQRSARPTPTLATKGNIIRNDIANIENTVRLAGAPHSQRFAFYDQELARQLPTGANAGATFQELFELLSDQVAKGYEATVVGNPTRNWRVSVGVARNESSESNIGTQHFEFIKERLPVWARYLNTPIVATPAITIAQLLPVAMQSWNYIRQSEGLVNPLGRKYRVTATTRYGFSEGLLKGAFAGSTYVWRSPAAVGFLTKTINDNEFAVPGVPAGPVTINDLSRPVRGGALTSFDVFLGYSRRLGKNLGWRVQLNVRNALNRDAPLVQRALTDGTGAIYTAQPPRLFILTNSFDF